MTSKYSNPFSYHISFSIPDSISDSDKAKYMAFFWILNKSDGGRDWPITYDWQLNKLEPSRSIVVCDTCGGFIYQRPRIGHEHVAHLIKVLGVDIKIEKFITNKTCKNSKVA